MKDLEFQAAKEARPETDPKSIVLEEYHDLLNMLSKKDLDTLPSHQIYDHKIMIDEEQKHSHAPPYKMLPQKLDVVKRYLDSHLAKEIFQSS